MSAKARALVGGRGEGQRGEPALDQLARLAEARRRAGEPVAALCGSRAAPGAGRALRSRAARGPPRAARRDSGKWAARIASPTPARPRSHPQPRRQPLDRVRRQRHGLLGPFADLLRRAGPRWRDGPGRSDAAGRRGSSAGSSALALVLARGDQLPLRAPPSPFAAPLPGDQELGPWVRASGYPGLVEPGGPHAGRVSSPTLTPTIVSRRLRKGRGGSPSTSTRTVPVSPGSSAPARGSGGRGGSAGSGRGGRRRSRSRPPRPPRRASGRRRRAPARRDVEGARAAASGPGRVAQLGAASARRRRRSRAPLLRRQQPPPARLAPLVLLELDPVGDVGVDLVESGIGAPSPPITVTISASLGEVLDRRQSGSTRRRPRRRSRRRRSRPRRRA